MLFAIPLLLVIGAVLSGVDAVIGLQCSHPRYQAFVAPGIVPARSVKEWLLEVVAVPPNVVDLSLPMVSKAYGHGTARK